MIPVTGLVFIERKTLIEEIDSAGKHSNSGSGYHIRFCLTSLNFPIPRGLRGETGTPRLLRPSAGREDTDLIIATHQGFC
jgi:hypothetical protein